jgi:hypothetical protein
MSLAELAAKTKFRIWRPYRDETPVDVSVSTVHRWALFAGNGTAYNVGANPRRTNMAEQGVVPAGRSFHAVGLSLSVDQDGAPIGTDNAADLLTWAHRTATRLLINGTLVYKHWQTVDVLFSRVHLASRNMVTPADIGSVAFRYLDGRLGAYRRFGTEPDNGLTVYHFKPQDTFTIEVVAQNDITWADAGGADRVIKARLAGWEDQPIADKLGVSAFDSTL